MSKNRYGPYSLGMITLVIFSVMTPAFAEVSDMNVNSKSFFAGEEIKFSGTVDEDSNGLVTIVIRDPNNEFVLLTQAIINPDYTFEKSIPLGEKFSEQGVYNATGFILNMTQGVTNNFGISVNGIPVITENETDEEVIQEEPVSKIADFVDANKNPQEYVYRYYTESAYKAWFDKNYPELTIEEAVGYVEEEIEEEVPVIVEDTTEDKVIADFFNPDKGAKYYVDRYYNEPVYKSWFDNNYPELTIEEAVGYVEEENKITNAVQDLIDNEIIPEAEASSIVEPVNQDNNPEIAQISLAIAALGILFGAVYGVKRKVDDNSKQISINRETIRKKLIHPIIGDSPKDILQTRLAKGEISIEEYEKLRMKLR